MNVNRLAEYFEDSVYVFLTINFLFGLYMVVVLFRRIRQLRFKTDAEQDDFMNGLEQHLRTGRFDEAVNALSEDPRGLPQLAVVTIQSRHLAHDQLTQFVSELMQRDIMAELEYRVSWVATVIKSGPLLGLFGTVLGMMGAFGRIGTGEKVEPAQIADEIAVALICTAMGLLTAIPFTYLLASINIRIRMLQDSLGSGLLRLLDIFRPRKH